MAQVSCFESPALEYSALKPLSLDELLIGQQKHSTFFCKLSGNNLVKNGLFDSDLLIANRALEYRDGDVVIAVVNGEFLVRVYSKGYLYCDNQSPIKCDENVMIESVVPYSIRMLRKLAV